MKIIINSKTNILNGKISYYTHIYENSNVDYYEKENIKDTNFQDLNDLSKIINLKGNNFLYKSIDFLEEKIGNHLKKIRLIIPITKEKMN